MRAELGREAASTVVAVKRHDEPSWLLTQAQHQRQAGRESGGEEDAPCIFKKIATHAHPCPHTTGLPVASRAGVRAGATCPAAVPSTARASNGESRSRHS